MNYQDNDNQNNGGIYSKFQERLRKIRLSRINKEKKNKKFVQDRVKEIREELSMGQTLRYKPKGIDMEAIELNKSREIDKDKVVVEEDVKLFVEEHQVINNDLEEKLQNLNENKPKVRKGKRIGYFSKDRLKKIDNISNIEKQELLNDLGANIIDKIKSNFEDKLDELEVLTSELYVLSQIQHKELELKKVNELKSKINDLIDKINIIIEQYNLYKKNYYIDNVIGIDDNIIVDDIINYRTLLNSFEDEKKFVKEYKALEEFKSLYEHLVEIKDETEKLKLENEDKIVEYQIRDNKYDDIKLGIVKVLDIDKKCSIEIDRQNKYFKELMGKISVIERQEYVTTHLVGIGNLLGNSLRYVGLLLVSPLMGLIPSISMHTIATRRMINNAYKNLHFEDVKHIKYEAVNYDSELNHHINDIDYADNLIDDALMDVDKFKEDFMLMYNSNIPGYSDTLKKINIIEKQLLHNQNRVAIIKKNLLNSKKLNSDKLKLVKTLNDKV